MAAAMRPWLTPAAIFSAAIGLAACATAPHAPISRQAAAVIRPDEAVAAAPEDPRRLIVSRALAMLGQPYRWGGDAPGGFDCSGLVLYATAGSGVHVPRTTHEQLQSGVSIPRRQVRAGDLVFMRLEHKELHVGIAIDNERFVHSPAAGRTVRIDSLDAQPYSRGFLTARRIVG